MLTPGITVDGTPQHVEPPLPKLPPDKFTDCYATSAVSPSSAAIDYGALVSCEFELARDERIVIDKCTNRDGSTSPPMAIQACNELLDRKLLVRNESYYIYVDIANAYVTQGDNQHALDNYNKAVENAPKRAQPYYYRGIFHAKQADFDAALRDFNIALSIEPKFVLALQQRAMVHVTQKDFSNALADFSEAIRVNPKISALWSERGYVYLLQRNYESAIKDEAEAIRLEPKLARAYFLRGAAFGDLGNSSDAVKDIVTAVGLDPLLDQYVSTKGKTASIALPPL